MAVFNSQAVTKALAASIQQTMDKTAARVLKMGFVEAYITSYLERDLKSINETLEVPLQELKNLWDLRFKGEPVTDELLLDAGKFYMDAAHRFRQEGFLYKKLWKGDITQTVYVVADPKNKNPEIT